MCGIYTSISKKETLCSEFLASLKELEYRGYDSAGITILDRNKYKTYKTLKKYERDFAKEINELSSERKKAVIENSKIASQVLSSFSKTI